VEGEDRSLGLARAARRWLCGGAVARRRAVRWVHVEQWLGERGRARERGERDRRRPASSRSGERHGGRRASLGGVLRQRRGKGEGRREEKEKKKGK